MSPGGTIWDSSKPEEELSEFEKLLSKKTLSLAFR